MLLGQCLEVVVKALRALKLHSLDIAVRWVMKSSTVSETVISPLRTCSSTSRSPAFHLSSQVAEMIIRNEPIVESLKRDAVSLVGPNVLSTADTSM
jgi:hypothetical protein